MTFQSIGGVAAKIVGPWDWYFAALKDPSQIGKTLKASEDSPQQGYYRTRRKGQPWEPVAIFYPEGSDQLVGYRSGREVRDINETWVWCLRYPVTYEAYQRAVDGGGWEDDDPAVAAQIGHNSGDVDAADALKDQIAAAKAGADAYAKISDDATAAKAQSLRSRLLELNREAEKKHEVEKAPHLEAGRAIDKKWLPLAKDAKAGADGIKKSLEAYESEKLRLRRAAEREADARRRAEDEARKAAGAGEAVAPPEPVSVPVPPAPAPIKGNYGRAATVGVRNVVTGISNPIELFKFVAADPEVEKLLLKLAQRAVDAGHTVPGVIVEEKARVS